MIGVFIRFLGILLLNLMIQLFVLSNIRFSPYVNVFLFPVFILLLPFQTPRWFLLMVSFLAGLLLDVFLGTIGIHAAASLAVGYVRPFLVSLITPRGTDFDENPNIRIQGLLWFSTYVYTSMAIYLGIYFLLEAMNLDNPLFLLMKWVLSLFFSGFVMLLFLSLVQSGKKRRFT